MDFQEEPEPPYRDIALLLYLELFPIFEDLFTLLKISDFQTPPRTNKITLQGKDLEIYI